MTVVADQVMLGMVREGLGLLQEQHEVFTILRMFILDEQKLDERQHAKCAMIKSSTSRRPRIATRGMRSAPAAPASSDKEWAQLTLGELHDFCGSSSYVLQVIVEEVDDDETVTRRLQAVEVGETYRRYRVTRDLVVKVSLVNFGSSDVVLQTFYKSEEGEAEDEGPITLKPWAQMSLDNLQTKLEEGQLRDTIILEDRRQGTTLRLLFEA